MTSHPAPPLDCLLVADDVTGACDAAVHFAAAGLRVLVPLVPDGAPAGAQVLACSTDSRDIDPSGATSCIRRLACRFRAREPRITYKKIDSTLRGNTAVEIIAALEAFACEAAVINPAFPAMGRIVRCGSLLLPADPCFQPVGLAAWLGGCGAQRCAHVPAGSLAAAIDSGVQFLSVDAVCHEDLATIAGEILAIPKRILWVGSAGLAAALAPHLACGHNPNPPPPAPRGPVLFCIGSQHPVTVEQQRRLAAHANRRHTVLAISPDGGGVDILGKSLARCQPAAIFVSGGRTASFVFRALGAHAIELSHEFAPGIPQGLLHGGTLDGIAVLTKSGGFGAPGDLVRIADCFHA